jgi:hypothetical protein
MKPRNILLILILFFLFPLNSFTQTYLFSNANTLRYYAATSEPDPKWYTTGFEDSAWPVDTAEIGFGYGDAGYTVINKNAKSLYTRFTFSIENKANIKALNFCPDYDDGYIAYLNGIEIARVNTDKSVQFPPFNAVATRSHASEFIMGITSPVLGIYLDSTLLANYLVNGENIIAVHVINDAKGTNLMYIPLLMDITNIPKRQDNYFLRFDGRCKRLIDVDSSDLPLVEIETDQNGIPYDDSHYSTFHMGIINNGEGKFNKPSDPFNEYNGPISLKLRGQSSRDFAKQSYRIKLIDENAADTSFALLGMPKESDWILFGPFADKSQVRNKFAYDLAAKMGHYEPRTRFCELMINGQLVGLYILTENIKRGKNRVDVSKMKDTDISGNDVTGGYIFKYDKTDANMGWRTNNREIVYPDVLMDEQKYYLKRFFTVYDSILNKTNDFLDPVKGFRKYASDSSLVDFIVFNEILKNADGYLYSTYLYKDRDDKDGRMKFGPIWDCDLAFGNTLFQQGSSATGWQFAINTGMFMHRYFQDTKFVEQFRKRWHELRAKTFSNDSIFSFLDQKLDEVRLARERNYEVWPVIDQDIFYEGYYVNSYENEIFTFKDWLTRRLDWIDNNVDLIYYPLKRVGNNPLELIAGNMNLRVYPNPFESEISISLNLEEESNLKIEFFNMTGQLQDQISRENVSGYTDIICNDSKLSNLKSGMYVAKVYVNGTPCQSLKIIKK